MKTLLHPLFIAASLLFLLNQLLERNGVHLPFIHAYLDDVLCMPVVLTIALAIQREFTFRNPGYTFTWWHIGFSVLWFSFVCEIIFPRYIAAYTADPLDVIAYMAGAIVFGVYVNAARSGY